MFPTSFKKIFSYACMRQEQLEKQKEIDKQLEILQEHCPGTVADLYRLERNINRINSKIVYKYSIVYNLGVIDKLLTQVNNFYDNIDDISNLNSSNTPIHQCYMLNKFITSYALNLQNGKLNIDNPYEHDGPIKRNKNS